MANGWTSERRVWQAALIQRWKPWEQSSGPTTIEGKERTRINARKHGLRSVEWRELLLALRAQARTLRNLAG